MVMCLVNKNGTKTTNTDNTNNFSASTAPADAGSVRVEEKKPQDGRFEVKGSFSVSVDENQVFTRPVLSTNSVPPVAE